MNPITFIGAQYQNYTCNNNLHMFIFLVWTNGKLRLGEVLLLEVEVGGQIRIIPDLHNMTNMIDEIKITDGAAMITTMKEGAAGVEIINITAMLLTMMIVVIIKIVITDDPVIIMMKEDVDRTNNIGIIAIKTTIVIMEEAVIMTITIDVIGNDVEALGRKRDLLKGLHLDKRIRFGIIGGRQWNCKRKLTQW